MKLQTKYPKDRKCSVCRRKYTVKGNVTEAEKPICPTCRHKGHRVLT